MFPHDIETRNAPSTILTLFDFIRLAAQQAMPVHKVEEEIWKQVLTIGRDALAQFFHFQGNGDIGPEVVLPDGGTAQRLDNHHERNYRSIFGDFTLVRTCYGSREGQRITFVPLDHRLQLPESDYSYLLQHWDATLGCESAFGRVRDTMLDVLGIEQPVDSLERIHRHVATQVGAFRDSRPLPEAIKEGELFVLTADGKGIPMRRDARDAKPKAKRGKGDKANKKRMAIVGAIYSVDRHPRTSDEVVAALFRDVRLPGEEPNHRPEPVGKHVWAQLSHASDGSLSGPVTTVFGWLKTELGKRDEAGVKEVVCVMDGQELLWKGLRADVSVNGVVEVLDLLHVIPRLWQAAYLFEKEASVEATEFVRSRLLRVLNGGVKGVVMGLRRQGTLRGLSATKCQQLKRLCGYLSSNASRMKYGEYLLKGYPIASGVIEGACRSYVKDRMERSGMRWTLSGAQSMLDVRSEYRNGQWKEFRVFRIEAETKRLYPYQTVLDGVQWSLAT